MMGGWRQGRARLPSDVIRRLLLLLILAPANLNHFGVAALTTVLDQHGFPLLQPLGAAGDQSLRGSVETKIRGRGGGGGLQRVELVHVGTFAVQHSSTTIKLSSRSSYRAETHRSPADVLELLEGYAVESPPRNREKEHDAEGTSVVPSTGAVAPLLLLNGHVCAMLSATRNPGNEEAHFILQEPYAWESDGEAEGFLLPQWMWDAVGGETGGGGLLMTAAPTANNTGAPSCRPPGLKSSYWNPITSNSDDHIEGNSISLGRKQCFEPFVQLASWGQGRFNSFAQFTSGELLLGGGSRGGAGNAGTDGKPAATQLNTGVEEKEKKRTDSDGMHTIRTREESLEIAAAEDLYLLSGTERCRGEGGEGMEGNVHVAAKGEHGTIHLGSDSLEWSPFSAPSFRSSSCFTNSSEPLSDATSSAYRPRAAASSFRIDGDRLEASGFLEAVRLSAARSFELAIAAVANEKGEERDNREGIGKKQGQAQDERPQQHRSSTPSPGEGLKITAALLRGDAGSLNASAGVVNVEATDVALVAGRNGVRVASSVGDVLLDANGANRSVVLEGSRAIVGAAPTILFTAGLAAAASAVDNSSLKAGGQEETEKARGQRSLGGGYLDLTAVAATMGGPAGGEDQGALLEVDDEQVRLQVSNSSLLRVSAAEISLQTPAIVLRSSAAEIGTEGPETALQPARKRPPATTTGEDVVIGVSIGPAVAAAGLSLDGGVFIANASASIEIETPGAIVQLFGRVQDGNGGSSDVTDRMNQGEWAPGKNNGGGLGHGMLVADADDVRIRASTGVSVVADGSDARARAWAPVKGGKWGENGTTTGGRLEVSLEGVSIEGNLTSLDATQRVALRVGGSTKGRTASPNSKEPLQSMPSMKEGVKEESQSSVELSDWGIRVVAGASTESSGNIKSSSNNDNINDNISNGSSTILLHARSRLVFVAPQLTISHAGDVEGMLNEEATSRSRIRSGSTRSDDGVSGGGGSGGLWSDGSALTARADRRVLLQAGLGPAPASDGANGVQGSTGSQISVEESWIHICAGGGIGKLSPPVAHPGTAAPAEGGSDSISGCVGTDVPRSGLMVEVAGVAVFSSTEDLQLHSEGKVRLFSANNTSLHSPRGILLSGSSPGGGDGTSDNGADAKNAKTGKAEPPVVGLGGSWPRGEREGGGNIILAPGAGNGVMIGPGFSSRDLASKEDTVSSLLYVANAMTNGTTQKQRILPPLDALVAVESSGNSGVSVLSPRGSASAVRFGCEGLPYSGGLEVRHHLDGPAGDALVLELASSPGRIVGDTHGRWGVGAVPIEETEGMAVLAATLHVFDALSTAESSDAGSCETQADSVAFLVESPSGSTGVIQLLNAGSRSSSSSSVPYPSPSAENAIVFSSRQSDRANGGHTHSHWVMSQLAAGGENVWKDEKSDSASRPQWVDTQAHPSSWVGGMTVTHVVSGEGPSGWRRSLGMAQPPFSSPPVAGAGAASDHDGTTARPVVAFAGGRSGFGTGSTGARVTVGGALMAEQVLVLSDEGLVKDIDNLGAQGSSRAMEAVRGVEVVSFSWTKESSASYGLELDVRQLGIIAQQAEREKASSSLVWRDATTGRKAVSHSRLLVTLVAAFQHLDASVRADGAIRDGRLQELERASVSAAESSGQISQRLGAVEATVETGLETLVAQAGGLSYLEGRFLEHGGQAEAMNVVLAGVRDDIAQQRGENQEWRRDRTRREHQMEEEILQLKSRLTAQEEHRKAQDEQILALSLRIGAFHASHPSKCDAAFLAELEALRTAQGVLEDRLAGVVRRVHQDPALNEEVIFLEEVRRLENNLRSELQGGMVATTTGPIGGDTLPLDMARLANGYSAKTMRDAEIHHYLETHKNNVHLGAVATVLRHREHLMAMRQMEEFRN